MIADSSTFGEKVMKYCNVEFFFWQIFLGTFSKWNMFLWPVEKERFKSGFKNANSFDYLLENFSFWYVFQNLTDLFPALTTFILVFPDGNKYKGGIYMVFEYMDHDLTGLADRPGMRFSVPQIKVSRCSDDKFLFLAFSFFLLQLIAMWWLSFLLPLSLSSATWGSFWQGFIIVM